jgi:hypothetical protein
MKPHNKICIYCKKSYRVKPYLLPTSTYCSRSCKAKATRIQIDANCIICKKPFTHISSRCNKAKYCSRICYHKGQHLNGTVKFNCVHCGKEFNGSPSHIGKRKYCSKKCTGKSYHETFKPNFTTVRKAMITRGLIKKCNRCGYGEEPLILGVHHKDRNRKNNTMENLEVLCPNCHSLEHLKHISHGFRE